MPGEEITKKDALSSFFDAVAGDSAIGKILIPIVKKAAKNLLNDVSTELIKYLFEQKAKEAVAPAPGSKGPGGKPAPTKTVNINDLLKNPKIRKIVEEVIKEGGI